MLRTGSAGDKAGALAEFRGKGVGVEGEARVAGPGTSAVTEATMGAVATEGETGATGRMKGAGTEGDDGIGETEAAEVVSTELIGDADEAEGRDSEEITGAGGEATGPKEMLGDGDVSTGTVPAKTGDFKGERL